MGYMDMGGSRMVTLKKLDYQYAGDIQRYASDREVSMYTHMPYPYPGDGAVQFIENSIRKREEGNFVNFAITLDGKFIGIVGLTIIKEDAKGRTAEIGYWIGKPFWHKGMATEAVKAMLHYGFEKMNVSVVIAQCLERNIGSYRVMEKNHFRYAGKQKNNGLTSKWSNDEYILRYELSKEAWQAVQSGNK
jgi:ribosomal-protein-alanine N-acetyltransferase